MLQRPEAYKSRKYRSAGSNALSVLLLFQLARLADAAPGDLDYSFAGFGYQAIVASAGMTYGMAVAPDGKIVTVGNSGVQLLVRRYRANGAPDPTFGSNGTATFLNPAYAMRATAVTVQPDGKIIVAGWAEAGSDDFLLARVNMTGTIDASFGSGGYRTTDFVGQRDQASAVLVQPDGKIVVAGTSTVGGDTDFSVARYGANGTPDPTFSGDGKLTMGFGNDDVCYDAALQSDGKIVLAGHGSAEFPNYDEDACLARLNSDGTLDDSFDTDGKLTVGLGGHDIVTAVAVQSDGKIVVAGYIDPVDPAGKLLRLHSSGIPDGSFGGDGIIGISGSDELYDIVVQPDGALLTLGEVSTPGELRFAVYRRLPDGSEDPSFSGDGEAFYDLGAYDRGQVLALLPDGRILAYGTTGPDAFADAGTVMVRLWPDGTPDIGGQTTLAFDDADFPPGSAERANGMAIQPDGKIVVAGQVEHAVSGESDFALARFLPDGELDTSFGSDGRVSFSFHNYDMATAVAVQPDGKIVTAGFTGTGDGVNFLVTRFLPDGAPDDTFGFFGFNVIDFMGGPDYANAVAIAPDGKILVAGTVFNGARNVFGVARFTSEGIADNSFDLDAKQLVEFELGVPHYATSVLVQPDRKIVVGGTVNGDFALMRLTEAGNLDDTFGCQGGGGESAVCSGKARIDMGADDYLYAIARAPNGWLYAAGPRGADFAVAQFNENGRLASCPPFPCENWPSGKAYLDWGFNDYAYAMDVRGDGQVVVAGTANGFYAWAQFGPTSTTPTVTGWTDLVGPTEHAFAVKFTGSNGLVLAGRQVFNGDENFALARFETTQGPTVDVPTAVVPGGTVVEALGPNPSQGSASLTFVLAQASPVEVRVYDVSGRLIRAMDAGLLQAGRHQATWDGRGDDGEPAHAGVFFVSLRVQGRLVGNRRLVIVR